MRTIDVLPSRPAFLQNFACLLTLVLACLATSKLVADNPPNIILILTDDHGWSQTAYPADPRVASSSGYLETPNLSRLARDGMRFTSGYSPAPLCTPTRRSIVCGTSAARSGSEFKSRWVPADHLTIPKALKLADPNYQCAHFGKWGEQMISTPEQCGYDASDGLTGNNTGGMPATLGVRGGHANGPPHFIDNNDPKRSVTVTDKSIDFMRKQNGANKPFYLQISYYAQHLSVVCTQASLEKYQEKGTPDRAYTQAWAAMMEELDLAIGRVLSAVDELGIADNTYIFFTADNGGRGTVPGGKAQRKPPNDPLTGAKHSLYEGGIRVPFVVRGPGIEGGSVSHTPVAGFDFLPTFFDLAGGRRIRNEPSADLDGMSIRPAWTSPESDFDRPGPGLVFHRPRRGFSALRQGDHKLMLFWAKNGQVKRIAMYDVSHNPMEDGHEITGSQPEKAEAMKRELLSYLKSVNAETVQ